MYLSIKKGWSCKISRINLILIRPAYWRFPNDYMSNMVSHVTRDLSREETGYKNPALIQKFKLLAPVPLPPFNRCHRSPNSLTSYFCYV